MSLAAELATFVVNRAIHDLPPQAVDYAQMLIASTVASAAAGSQIESARIVRALEVERGGAAEATLWFGSEARLPVAAAARVNAMMSDGAASDDSDLRNYTHPGTTACASALAMAEKVGSSGEDILAAIVLGYEVSGRINNAMQDGGLFGKGFHGCIVSSFAGAVAAARLMRLDADGMTRTIALTATSVGGLHAAASTSVAREYHAGLAAMLGVNAAQAAAKGFRPEERILEMPRGFLESLGNKPDPGLVTQDLGSRWSILTEMSIKLVPGAAPLHAVAEAAANLSRAADLQPDDVASITYARPGAQYLGPQFPTTLVDVAHSPAFFAAAGVADRGYTWEHVSQEKIDDPRIRSLLGKVRVGQSVTQNVERYRSGATVTIETVDGRTLSDTVYVPKGSAMAGIAWSDVETKYRALVPSGGIEAASIETSLQLIRKFRSLRDVTELTELLRQPRKESK